MKGVGPGQGGGAALVVTALLVLGAGVRLLRFGGPFPLWAHWDEVRLALPALAILQGTFPVHHLGVEYMGAGPAYPLAAWFFLAGSSPLALDVFGYGAGLAILVTGWLLARRLLPGVAARCALATLAVPPLLLARWSLNGNLNYPLLLILGNLFLLGTHTLFGGRRPARANTLVVVGLLAGLGVWTNLLFVVYLAPFAWLALATGLVRRPRVWLFAAGVLLGSLPMWLYELDAFPSARFAVGESGDAPASLGVRALLVLTHALPALLGVEQDPRRMPALAGVFALLVLAIGVAALVRAAARPGPAGVLLWGVAVANVALVILTSRGGLVGGTGVRYLLPLYSVLPCWIGAALAGSRGRGQPDGRMRSSPWWGGVGECAPPGVAGLGPRRPGRANRAERHEALPPTLVGPARRAVGAAALAVWLVFQGWANWEATVGTTPPGARRWTPILAWMAPLVGWLDAHGVRRFYWADVPSMTAFEFTYLTGGRIVAADPWRDEAHAPGRLVDAAPNPPFVIIRETAAPLVASLAGLGMDVRATAVGGVRILEPVPAVPMGFAPLPRHGWVAAASENAADAPLVLDGDAATGWRTSEKTPGQWLAVDLAGEATVARVDLLAVDWHEVPVGFRVEVSRDGARWETVAEVARYWGPLFLAGPHPVLKVRRGRVQAIFRPVRARHVRVVQTGADSNEWAVRELFVYAPKPAPPLPPPGELGAALAREGVHWLYADAWAAAVVATESGGGIRSQESNLFVNAYGRDRPDPTRLDRFRAAPGRAILVPADADAEAIRATLVGRGIPVREAAAGPYRLLVFDGAARPARRLAMDGWSATASEAPALAWRAIDGEPATAWTTAGPAGPETTFTLDLRVTRTVRGVRVRPGGADGGAPDLSLEGSSDGARWTPLGPPAWAGSLYWTGAELLRNGAHAWEVLFPPARLRYLRLRPAAAQAHPWLVGEIECFE